MRISPLAPTSLLASLAAAGLAAASVAAQPQNRTIAAGAVISQVHGLRPTGDGLVAHGPTYVADFTAASVTYTPILGQRAPRNLPLRLQLAALGRGSALVAAAPAAPRADGLGVVYDRGGAVERFDVRADGVALSLRFDAPLAGQGDLVVRYEVASDVTAPPQATAASGLRFVEPDIGGVVVGGVTGIDAGGRRAAGVLRCTGRHLDLVLPGAFVSAARYPLLLDPLLGTEVNFASGGSIGEPDVAYDPVTDRYLVVWRAALSNIDWRVFGTLVDARTGAVIGTPGTLEARPRGTQSLHPAVGVPASGRFLVLWQNGPTMFGPWELHYLAVDATNATVSNTLVVQGNGSLLEEPVLANGNVGQDVMAAWTMRGTGITVARFSVPPTGDPSFLASTTSGDTFAHGPAISRSGPASATFAMAWISSQPGAEQLMARSVQFLGPTGLSAGNILTVATPASFGSFGAVDVDGDGTQFVVAWDETDGQTTFSRDVSCQQLRWDGSALQTVGSPRPQANTAGDDTHDPAIAFLGPRYAIAWTHALPGVGAIVEGRDLSLGCTRCSQPWSVQTTNQLQGSPRFGTQRAGGSATGDALLVCIDLGLNLPSFTGAVHGALFSAFGAGGSVTPAGSACGSAGTPTTAGGPPALGNASFRLELSGVPPSSSVFANIGLPGGEIVCGSCTITNGVVIVPVAPQGGTYSLGLPMQCNLSWLGTTLSAQWLVFGGAGRPCPPVSGLAASQRLHLTIGE